MVTITNLSGVIVVVLKDGARLLRPNESITISASQVTNQIRRLAQLKLVKIKYE